MFEDDSEAGVKEAKDLVRAGTYPKDDTLKNHVDPLTCAYIRRFFALVNVPENEYSKYRPWLLNVMRSEGWMAGVNVSPFVPTRFRTSVEFVESARFPTKIPA